MGVLLLVKCKHFSLKRESTANMNAPSTPTLFPLTHVHTSNERPGRTAHRPNKLCPYISCLCAFPHAATDSQHANIHIRVISVLQQKALKATYAHPSDVVCYSRGCIFCLYSLIGTISINRTVCGVVTDYIIQGHLSI